MFLKNESLFPDLLEKAKAYLKKYMTCASIYQVAHPMYYLAAWAPGNLGYYKLKCIKNGKLISRDFLLAYIRSLLDLGYQNDYKFFSQSAYYANTRVIVSWCREGDFLEDGSFDCKYFNENSRTAADVIWILISLDGFIPLEMDNNISIVQRAEQKKKSLFFLAKNVVFCIKNKISFFKESIFAKQFADFFVEHLNVHQLKQVLIPYEAQPWQHTLSFILKKMNRNIEIVGDLHTCLPPLPTDFIKRCGFPDKVIVHGQGQKDIMVHSLGWSDEHIEVSPSRRLTKNNFSELASKILLPYALPNTKFVLDRLKKFFQDCGAKLGRFDTRNHPVQTNSKEHINLMREIESLQSQYLSHDYDTLEKNISVVIGASSVIVECLTRGIEVFHITDDVAFSRYDHSIWREIQSIQVDENIWKYNPLVQLTYLDIKENIHHG